MKARKILLMLVVSVGIATYFIGVGAIAGAQPAAGAVPQAPAGGAAAPKVEANLQQLMRGILFPSSNVVFAAQKDISKLPKAPDPTVSPNLLTSSYGGWEAVANASLALSESANLIVMPGRVCANGKPVPVQRPDWQKFAQGLRDSGMSAYKAAMAKSTDDMVDASGDVTEACDACHKVYRDNKAIKDRCIP